MSSIMSRLSRITRLGYYGVMMFSNASVMMFSNASVKGTGSGGSIRSTGGKFSEMEMACEEQYFRKLQQQQLDELKKHLEEAKHHHEEEIKTHDEAIEELEEQLQWHREKKRRHEKKLSEKKDLLDDD
ncbi:ATPase inhibitor mai-1, mitochondrial-like [Dysidea avara]|uniref:ATPase inhibitor mai-1, mitochondrial-like n=1 Tax=Dysidea avara TaxID=196820 RepID=UPI00331DCC5B